MPSRKSTLSLFTSRSARLTAVAWVLGVVEQHELHRQLLPADLEAALLVTCSNARS